MSGWKLAQILGFLHCCDPTETGMNDNGEYDPSYKVGELSKLLEARWKLRKSEVTPQLLAEWWLIGLNTAKQSIENTTQ